MKRLVLAILVILAVGACSGGKKKQDTAATGSGSAIYAKKIVVSWGIAPKGTSAEIYLETTDETGKQTSFPVGTYEGTCQVIKPAEEMKALSGVNCTGGMELHAVVNDADIVVLKLKVQVGVTPDPMAREEVTRVKAPAGASIEAA
jgi:predicted outer membrane repeat protein